MKRQYVYGAAISLLALIVLVSGCTSGPASGPTATPMPPMDMPMGAVTPAPSATPASGDGTTPAALFDHDRFAWYQYKITSGAMDMPMTMIHTYRYDDETYRGMPARHANITLDMRPEQLVYLDIWSDTADNHTINIHAIVYDNGRLTKNADVDAANLTKWEGIDLASPKFLAASLQPAGTDSVTAGSKSYAAMKYAGTAGEQRYMYWVSQDVPVPVKLVVHDSKGDTTYELAGWG